MKTEVWPSTLGICDLVENPRVSNPGIRQLFLPDIKISKGTAHEGTKNLSEE